ncbi:hypothetical protein [Lacipirellula parvula]|uniref:Uncharacterized protein n=1 Tax=Lacipirellula parvula TaxID=2650471 RepID=A0A5K7XDV4_9BACT|nr:hypothetical protein [Lacipirellula parvula]BBO34668.1 hypothetical protein PLANPX_4280 [Lacipirellula parvula]
MNPSTCDKCGGSDLHEGTVDAFQPIVFRPTGPNEYLPKSVTVLARLCATCGVITLSADAASLKAFHLKP